MILLDRLVQLCEFLCYFFLMKPSLTVKQRVFVEELVKTREPMKAALIAYKIAEGTNSSHVASSIAYQNMRNPRIRAYMDSFYFSDEELIKLLKNALDATKSIKGTHIKEPDWSTRFRALELAFMLKGYFDRKDKETSRQHRNITVKFRHNKSKMASGDWIAGVPTSNNP